MPNDSALVFKEYELLSNFHRALKTGAAFFSIFQRQPAQSQAAAVSWPQYETVEQRKDYFVQSLATAHSASASNPNAVDIRADSNRSWISYTVGGKKILLS